MRWIGPISDHERMRPRPRASATLIPPTPMKRLREDVYALRFAAIRALVCVPVRSARSLVALKRSSSALIAGLQGRSRLVAGGACAVELRDGGQRTIERVVVAPDPPEHQLVVGRRHEAVGHLARRRPELRQAEADLPVDERPASPSERALRAGQAGGSGIAPDAKPEQVSEHVRLRLQRPVRR